MATHGVTCLTCDTSDIPTEGVPLGGGSLQAQTARHQSAIGSGSYPLINGGGAPFNAQFYPRQSQKQFVPAYAGGSGYTNYQKTISSYQSASQFRSGGAGYQQPFNPYSSAGGFSYRNRRSTRSSVKPVSVSISRKSKPKVTLIRMVSLLKNASNLMNYHIIHGNSSLFQLSKGEQGIDLQNTIQLDPGFYNLAIDGEINENNNEMEEELRRIYRDSRKFLLRVSVHVL